MTRKELVADMQRVFGCSMLSKTQFDQYTGLNKDRSRVLLRNTLPLPYNDKGNYKRYHVLDLADVIMTYRNSPI